MKRSPAITASRRLRSRATSSDSRPRPRRRGWWQVRVVCGRGRDPTLSRYPPRGAAFRASEDPARAMRASDPAFRVDQRVGAEPLDRRRGRPDGSRTPAGLDEPADQVLCARGASSRSRSATAGPAGPPLPATPASRRATATSRWTCSATPCGRRASTTRSTSTTTSPPASATTGRVSTLPAGPAEGRRASWSGSSTASAAIWLIWSWCPICAPWPASTPAGPRRWPTDPARCLTRGRPARVRHLRGAGRVRAEADPRTHRGRAQGRTGPRSQGQEEVRAVESPGAAGPGRDGAPRHVGVRTVPRTRHQASDALPVRRPAGPAARAGPRRSSPPESEDRDAGRA